MTVDFQLAFPCPHITVEERVSLGSDRRTLPVRQPINSAAFTQVIANNDLELSIPQGGLFSQARIVSSVSGPFRVCTGLETVTITNPVQSVSVALPVGNRVTALTVMERVQRAFRDANAQMEAVVNNGFLTLSDTSTSGPNSRIRISGAPQSIGFNHNRGARGRQLYPGWEFYELPDVFVQPGLTGFQEVAVRGLRFTEPVHQDPVFKVTYSTLQRRCRRCQTFAIENDLRFDEQGNALTIGNENLLQQMMLKILTTRRGSNPFHTWYGATLDRIGSKNVGAAFSLREDVASAVENFRALQREQGKFQDLTARETLRSVTNLTVTPSEVDPTVLFIYIEGVNASGRPVEVNTVYAAPGTAALAGSNGLSLGLAPLGLADSTTGSDIF